MSVLLPNEKMWLVSNWISHEFFIDCLPFLDKSPSIEEDIRFCVDASVDTLDMRDKDLNAVYEIRDLVISILDSKNMIEESKPFIDRDLRIYFSKIKELRSIVDEYIKDVPELNGG